MQKIVGTLSDDDKKEIEDLFDKKNALEQLLAVIDVNNADLYNRVISDYEPVVKQFNNWWEIKRNSGVWESAPNHQWTIDFKTGNVLLINS